VLIVRLFYTVLLQRIWFTFSVLFDTGKNTKLEHLHIPMSVQISDFLYFELRAKPFMSWSETVSCSQLDRNCFKHFILRLSFFSWNGRI